MTALPLDISDIHSIHLVGIMALAKSVYNLLFRRTSTFAITIMVGAVFFERMFDQGGDAIFESLNRGVSTSLGVFTENVPDLLSRGRSVS